jgi:Ca2+-binding RTX toxin-like protein
MSVAAAKTALASLVASGNTNYDAALATAQTAFGTATGKITGAQNVSYFFSDGAPTAGTEISAADETTWTTFLDNNQIRSFAIGMGTGVTQAPMDPIAYNGQNNEAANAVVVTNLSQLDTVLAGTIQNPVAGPLVTGGNFGAGALLGADGGDVHSITVNGTTYTYNPASGGSIAATGGTNSGVFDTSTNTLTVTTAAGGSFVVDMDNGNYRYSAPNGLAASIVETMDYVIADHDGDTQASSVVVEVDRTNLVSGTSSAETINGTSAADLVMARQGNDIVVGGNGRDALLGGAGNDQLSGGDGDDDLSASVGADTLDGGAGADHLIGGAGNDQLTGGAGADVFAWQLVDRGANGTPAADIITDFNVASPAAGGDTLDLRDLLQNEGSGNLAQFLDFDTTSVPGSTVIHISSSGGFASGSYSAAAEDQRITLQGVDLRSSLGLGGGASDNDIIQELVNRGKLITDGM